MKRNVLLVAKCNHGATSPEPASDKPQQAFEVVSLAIHEINLAIVDIGANVQSLAIVESLAKSQPAPPVIALVDGSDATSIPLLHHHGAAACLKKPFNADELARLIEAICASTSHDNCPSCDKWGHPGASSRKSPASRR